MIEFINDKMFFDLDINIYDIVSEIFFEKIEIKLDNDFYVLFERLFYGKGNDFFVFINLFISGVLFFFIILLMISLLILMLFNFFFK